MDALPTSNTKTTGADGARPIGIVVIGRNEGERLLRSLRSVVLARNVVVYVDSDSTDNSVKAASDFGAHVVELDMSKPFSAARARNEGFAKLLEVNADIEFVQFIDGDCEVAGGWLAAAEKELRDNPTLAVVCGRRRERFPDATVYNRLCDMEWDTPIGEAKSCGGDAMMRVSAFCEVGGYNPAVIAGEEPEMCVRLRKKGWRIMRIDHEMALHDADMHRFGQWWKRAVRSGHAYAEGAAMHGKSPERHWIRETRSNWFWALILPMMIAAAAILTHGWAALLLAVYPALVVKIAIWRWRRKRDAWKIAVFYAFFCVLGKMPQVVGQTRYWKNRLSGKSSTLIEYKGCQPNADSIASKQPSEDNIEPVRR